MNEHQPRLIAREDYTSRFSMRKQKAIQRLGIFYNQGVPAVWSSLPREDLLLLLNVLLFKSINNQIDAKPAKKQDKMSMAEYGKQALALFAKCGDICHRLKRGARLSSSLVVHCILNGRTAYFPIEVFLSLYDDPGVSALGMDDNDRNLMDRIMSLDALDIDELELSDPVSEQLYTSTKHVVSADRGSAKDIIREMLKTNPSPSIASIQSAISDKWAVPMASISYASIKKTIKEIKCEEQTN